MTDYLIKYKVFIKNEKKCVIIIQEGVSYRDNKVSITKVVNKEDAKNFLIISFNSKVG